MTLKEKFKEIIFNYDYVPNTMTKSSNQCEEIADEFAIGFASWFHKNFQNQGIQIYTRFGRWEKVTIEEALEIYKKEKEL